MVSLTREVRCSHLPKGPTRVSRTLDTEMCAGPRPIARFLLLFLSLFLSSPLSLSFLYEYTRISTYVDVDTVLHRKLLFLVPSSAGLRSFQLPTSRSFLTVVLYHRAGNSLSEVESRLSTALRDSRRGWPRLLAFPREPFRPLRRRAAPEVTAGVNFQRRMTRPIFRAAVVLTSFKGVPRFKARGLAIPTRGQPPRLDGD